MDNYSLAIIDRNAAVAESSKLLREMVTASTTKQQLDIIISIASLVKENDEDFKFYKVTYNELGKIINPANPRTKIVQKEIDDSVKGLMSSSFCIRTESLDLYYHWIEHVRVDKDEKTVYFKLSSDVKKFYLKLQNGKTIYLLNDLLSLSTMFQANLFRWLSANCNFANPVGINIEDAKLQFNNDTEILTKKFIEKLDRALDKINNATHVYATYEKIYEGKKLIRLDFSIDNTYTKVEHKYFPSEIKANNEKKKKTWEENKELKKQNNFLETVVMLQNLELDGKENIAKKYYENYKE